MIDPLARIAACYAAGLVFCVVWMIGVFRGSPLLPACTRSIIAAAGTFMIVWIFIHFSVRILFHGLASKAHAKKISDKTETG